MKAKKTILLCLLSGLLVLSAGCGSSGSASTTSTGAATSGAATLEGLNIGSDLVITSTGRYAGLFVEDGSDETVSDVFSIQVKNNSKNTVQYAHIKLTRGKTCYEFDLSTLPAGATVQALELNKQKAPDKLDGFTPEVTAYAVFSEKLSLHKDVFQLKTADNTVTITNRSKKDVSKVYVYYKTKQNDLYMGGITYRVGIDSLAAGETKSGYTKHFRASDSEILFITYAS